MHVLLQQCYLYIPSHLQQAALRLCTAVLQPCNDLLTILRAALSLCEAGVTIKTGPSTNGAKAGTLDAGLDGP